MGVGDREEIGKDSAQIKQRHNDEADDSKLVPPEAPPRQLQLGRLRQPIVASEGHRRHARPCKRMRGSIHISNKSDIRVPITVSTPSSNTMVPARNMSCATKACSSNGPTVGSPSTS